MSEHSSARISMYGMNLFKNFLGYSLRTGEGFAQYTVRKDTIQMVQSKIDFSLDYVGQS